MTISTTATDVPGTTAPWRVLIVDDEPDMRLLLRVVLEQAGFEVAGVAGDGLDALEQFGALAPDAVVVDLAMPKVNGAEVIAWLRQRSAVTLVGFSAAPSREDERLLLRLGVPLVMKEAGAAALVRMLGALHHEPRGQSPAPSPPR